MKKWISVALLGISLGAGNVQAQALSFTATLSGGQEVPPNASGGRGSVAVTLDRTTHQLQINSSFSDLVGTTTAAHIHCCATPGNAAPPATTVPTFAGFPLGTTGGNFQATLDTTDPNTFNPSFLAAHGNTPSGAEAALAEGMIAGSTYFNIHTSAYPGGELRGNLVPIPEPSTYALMTVGLLALGALARRRR